MNLPQIITQLRTYAPVFAQRVGGGSTFDQVLDRAGTMNDEATGRLIYPVAWVVPDSWDAEPSDAMTGLYQNVTETMAIYVLLDGTPDRRGQAAASIVPNVLTALHGAVLNWHSDPDASPYGWWFVDASEVATDRAQVWWRFRYSIRTTLTDADGFQVTGDPLTDIGVTANLGDAPGDNPNVPPFNWEFLPSVPGSDPPELYQAEDWINR